MKTKPVIFVIPITLLIIVLTAFTKPGETPKSTIMKGVDLPSIDKSKSPKIDLFDYANGNWVKNNPIPQTESRWGAFNELAENNRKLLRTIIEEAAADKKATKGSIKQKVGDFYAIAMDTVKLEKEGATPIEADMKKINAIASNKDLMIQIAMFHSYGIGPLFGFSVQQDMKKSDEYICYVGQGGLGLPDRDYYIKEDDDSKKTRAEYLKHIAKMFELYGMKSVASNTANKMMEMETQLAKASMTNVELRDDEKQYNKFAMSELNAKYPDINWSIYFETLGVKGVNTLIVTQPLFFQEVNNMMKSYSLEDWKTYLRWNLLNDAADKLSSVYEKQNFYFYSTVLQGTKEMRPRWKRMVGATNGSLGEAVGQLYVEKVFSPESKKRVNEMVDNLMVVYKDRIQKLDWMSEATKQQALIKLSTFTRKLGYPDKWKDYTSLEINRESYYRNHANSMRYEFNRNIARLGKPIDKTEWGMSPQTVNAYYNPQLNEIVFPAAIMQPPFFSASADDAVNYGAMGSVIGHEITHGFDDMGSKYDQNGNLSDWWTKEDRALFNERTAKLVKQFNDYKVFDDLNVNGELTLGENIADLGGLTMSYLAYQRSLEGKKREVIDGMSPEQRFFIAWAQAWRGSSRPEALRQQVKTNPHSPEHFRAIAAPSNLPEYYKAFDLKAGDQMYKADAERAKVW